MGLFSRHEGRDARRRRTRCPAARRRCRSPRATSCSAPRSCRPSPRAWSSRWWAWAASGAPSGSSGRPRASTRPPSATPAGTRPTRPTRRSAPGAPGHNEVVRVVFDPAVTTLRGHPASASGRATTPPRACARATTSAPSTARASTSYSDAQREIAEASPDAYQQRLDEAGYGPITTEIVPAARLLLRRGLPPAVPRQGARTATAASAGPASPARWASSPTEARSAGGPF